MTQLTKTLMEARTITRRKATRTSPSMASIIITEVIYKVSTRG